MNKLIRWCRIVVLLVVLMGGSGSRVICDDTASAQGSSSVKGANFPVSDIMHAEDSEGIIDDDGTFLGELHIVPPSRAQIVATMVAGRLYRWSLATKKFLTPNYRLLFRRGS